MRVSEDNRRRLAGEAYLESLPQIDAMARKAGLDAVNREEVIQRVAVILLEKADEFDPARGTRRSWALGIAHREVLRVLREARAERRRMDPDAAMEEVPSDALTPEQTLGARESIAIATRAVRRAHRTVFALDAEGHTATEIGQLLDMPRSTAEWRLKEAREDVNRALSKLGEDRESASRVRGVPALVPAISADFAGDPTLSGLARRVARSLRLSVTTAPLPAVMTAGLTLLASLFLARVPPPPPVTTTVQRAAPALSPTARQAAFQPAILRDAMTAVNDAPSVPSVRPPLSQPVALASGPLNMAVGVGPQRQGFARQLGPAPRRSRRKWMLAIALLSWQRTASNDGSHEGRSISRDSEGLRAITE